MVTPPFQLPSRSFSRVDKAPPQAHPLAPMGGSTHSISYSLVRMLMPGWPTSTGSAIQRSELIVLGCS